MNAPTRTPSTRTSSASSAAQEPLHDSESAQEHQRLQAAEDVESEAVIADSDDMSRKEAQSTVRKERPGLVWWPELLSASMSIALLAAAGGVLYYFDNEPLDTWNMPWHIKPNTLISILMTLCRLAMLLAITEGISQLKWEYFAQQPHTLGHFQTFDDASRGPWGALLLLWTIKWRAAIASLGALLIILALAMDPFTQQVLSYPLSNSINGTASIGFANAFDYNTNYTAGYNPVERLDPAYGNVNSAVMSGAILQSLSNSTINSMHFDCPSGNCTLGAFSTLGICSQCKDVSSEVKERCTYHPTRPDTGSGECEYETPLGQRVGAELYMDTTKASIGFTLFNATVSKKTTYTFNGTKIPDITYISALRLPPDWLQLGLCVFDARGYEDQIEGIKRCKIPSPTVYDCTLYWCMKSYAATNVTNGKLIEQVNTDRKLDITIESSYDYWGTNAEKPPPKCQSDKPPIPANETNLLSPPLVPFAYPEGSRSDNKTCPAHDEKNSDFF